MDAVIAVGLGDELVLDGSPTERGFCNEGGERSVEEVYQQAQDGPRVLEEGKGV